MKVFSTCRAHSRSNTSSRLDNTMAASQAVSFDLESDIVARGDAAFEDELPFVMEEPTQNTKRVASPLKSSLGTKSNGLLRPLDLECRIPNVNPGRPKLLGQFLDGMTESLVQSDAQYKHFVALCETALADAKSCDTMDVKCTLKYEIPAEYQASSTSTSNNSMVLTFMFYAAMQQAGSASFQATEIANETLSYYELDKFCRDFDIVPKLLTKSEVKAIWQDYIAMQAQLEGGAPLQALKFSQFQDMFVRLSLYAYNKAGMKKMILAVTGFFPTPENIIESMCQHCYFHDFSKCQDHIRSVGRETQGALNFRSKDDTNNRARAEIRIDLRAKFLARQSAKENKEKDKAEAEKERKRKLLAGDQLDDEKNAGKKDFVQYGLWSSLNGKKYEKTKSLFEITNRKVKAHKSLLPNDILSMLDGKHDDAASLQGGSKVESSSASVEGSVAPDDVVDLSPEEPMTYDKATAIAKKKGTRIELIADQYDRDLVQILSKYSRTDPAPDKVGSVESGSVFLDAGYLPPGTTCSLVIQITNLTLDILQLDVTSEDVGDENTRVIISPQPLISGMVRKAVVKFTVGNDLLSRVCFCNIHAFSKTGLNCDLKLPIFYRADATCSPHSLLTIKSLPEMCMRYLGRKYEPHSTFERRRDESSVAWLRPQTGNTIRRSIQEMRPTSSKAKRAETALRANMRSAESRSMKLIPPIDAKRGAKVASGESQQNRPSTAKA